MTGAVSSMRVGSEVRILDRQLVTGVCSLPAWYLSGDLRKGGDEHEHEQGSRDVGESGS